MSKQATATQAIGLGAFLVAPAATDTGAAMRNVAIVAIREDPDNARQTYPKTSLEELAASMRSRGLLEPILLRPGEEDGTYAIIAGHRRFRAAKLLGWEAIPSIIRTDVDAENAGLDALIENLQREDLIPYEQALALSRVLDSGLLNRKELGERAGITQNTLRARLELIEFGPSIGRLIGLDGFSLAHAKLMAPLADVATYAGLGKTPTDDEKLRSGVLAASIKAIGKGKDTALVADAPQLIAEAIHESGVGINTQHDAKLITASPGFLASIKKMRHVAIGDAIVVFDLQAYKDKRLAYKAHAKNAVRTATGSPVDKKAAAKRRSLVGAATDTQVRDALIAAKISIPDAAWAAIQDETTRLVAPGEVDFALRFAQVGEEKAQTAFRALFPSDHEAARENVAYKTPTKWWTGLTETQQVRLALGLNLAGQLRIGAGDGFLRQFTGKTSAEWLSHVDAQVKDEPAPEPAAKGSAKAP